MLHECGAVAGQITYLFISYKLISSKRTSRPSLFENQPRSTPPSSACFLMKLQIFRSCPTVIPRFSGPGIRRTAPWRKGEKSS